MVPRLLTQFLCDPLAVERSLRTDRAAERAPASDRGMNVADAARASWEPYPATEAERRAHYRMSMRRTLTAMAAVACIGALFILLIFVW